MSSNSSGTPNTSDGQAQLRDRRPMVARALSERGPWIFAGVAALGAGLLFTALETRRAEITAPAIAPSLDRDNSGNATLSAPPELALPLEPVPSAMAPGMQAGGQLTLPASMTHSPLVPATPDWRGAQRGTRGNGYYAPGAYSSSSPPTASSTPNAALQSGPPQPTGPEVVYQAPPGGAGAAKANGENGAAGKSERVEASRFANPSTTVPKGTVMQAVLESALDSTRAGIARAIVSRDVYSFDGAKVLIPRGSRLIGEYKSDLAQGQNRALIEWTRLMRPDGVITNLASPSADPLGRAGIKGKINGHFVERFGGAILQSALNIGQQVAVNKIAAGTQVYAIPLTTQGNQAMPQQDRVVPTLTVRQGTSVSVFVAHDLDFAGVEP